MYRFKYKGITVLIVARSGRSQKYNGCHKDGPIHVNLVRSGYGSEVYVHFGPSIEMAIDRSSRGPKWL